MEEWLASDALADANKAAIGGFVIGLAFGGLAQASRFCLRSACLEFWGGRGLGRIGNQVVIWLCVFGAAVLGTQLLFTGGMLDASEIRQLSSPGSLSGAVIGGLLFGVGMVLARGCASRLLVLSATGNMRALVAGLIVTVVAQASLNGVLSPLRGLLSGFWTLPPSTRNLMDQFPDQSGILIGAACLILALIVGSRTRPGVSRALFAVALGATVTAGWFFTASLAHVSFEPVTVGSVTFTGPSADTLMALITAPNVAMSFNIGMVPGVFVGAFLSALVRREFRIQSFNEETGTARYIIGAALMGFGGMLAGGCAVGAGITGGAVLSLTAWVALCAMWVGAGLARSILDRTGIGQSAPIAAAR